MSVKKGFARALDTAQERLYTRTVRDTVERVGLLSQLRRAYFVVYSWSTDNRVDVAVDGASATFHVSNYKQLKVMNRLRGSEWGVARRLLAELNHDDVFWDVGANVGQYSCLAADVIDEGDVVAVEPYPLNVEILMRNVRINESNVDVRAVALADSEGETTFYLMDTTDAGASQGSITPAYAEVDAAKTAVTVRTTTGDRLVRADAVPPPDVVKMDVEGAAPEAIRGMADVLASTVRLAVVETHDNAREVETLLADLGFRLEYEGKGGSHPMIFAYAQ